MNLANDPWIPCIMQDGTSKTVSMLDCFTCEDIVDIAVRPHERVALMRLLLCVAYAAAGIPADYDGWEALKDELPTAVTGYLKKWKDSFELFHAEKPFLQVAGLNTDKKTDELTPFSKLDFSLATGNNSTVRDHAALAERTFSSEWLALNLLTYQMFSLGGLIGSVLWNGRTTGRTSCDGPCSPGSMLHTFLRSKCLRDTIHINMLSEEELSDYKRLGNNWQGRPIWEAFPAGLDDTAKIDNATQTFLGRMVPLTRAVKLKPEKSGMLLGDGLPFPSYNNPQRPFPQEVSATVVTTGEKNKRVLLGVQLGKSIWRQLAALTVIRHGEEPGGCAALVHSCDAENVDMVVCGLARGKADVVDVVESVFHVPSSIYETEGHEIYEYEVSVAENVARGLGFAVERYRRLVDGGWEARLKLAGAQKGEVLACLKSKAFSYYWTAVETGLSLLWDMLRTLGSDAFPDATKAWRSHLEKHAYAAYAVVCGTETERQMRAFIKGKRILAGALYKCMDRNRDKEQS